MNIAVLASHEGATFQAIAGSCSAKVIPARVVAVISNNGNSGVLQRARAQGIPSYHLSSRIYPEATELDQAICAVLVNHEADVVVLAGYMKQVGTRTLTRFRGRILNAHLALLPKFGGRGMYGLHVHRAVLAASEDGIRCGADSRTARSAD